MFRLKGMESAGSECDAWQDEARYLGGMESDPQSNREEANKLLESDLAIANWAGERRRRRRRRNCKHRSIFEDLSTQMAHFAGCKGHIHLKALSLPL
ncbi:hypothetical protein D5086_024830 [Populus alba]|uniref:Uncharacterized protein n=1 Tax=Populus alba TaxID=43335 RepID=A0ACC4B707_POPAL